VAVAAVARHVDHAHQLSAHALVFQLAALQWRDADLRARM